MERLVFGRKLEHIRSSLLPKISAELDPSAKVLVVGDGDGRFLCDLLKLAPDVKIDYLEMSGTMIEQAQKRLGPVLAEKVNWVHSDLIDWQGTGYDLVTSHFVLDCFDGEELEFVIRHLSSKLSAKGRWVISDFDPKVAWWAAIWVKMMYLFFKTVSSLRKCELKRADGILQKNGLTLIVESSVYKGFIYSSLWGKETS